MSVHRWRKLKPSGISEISCGGESTLELQNLSHNMNTSHNNSKSHFPYPDNPDTNSTDILLWKTWQLNEVSVFIRNYDKFTHSDITPVISSIYSFQCWNILPQNTSLWYYIDICFKRITETIVSLCSSREVHWFLHEILISSLGTQTYLVLFWNITFRK